MKTIFSTVLFIICTSISFSQVVGGRGNSDMTPTVAEPAKISSGGFSGDVNLFSGSYGASIPLGSVSTPGGLVYNLAFNYNSSFTVGTTPQLTTGIPYGEGWNLSIPTISVETEAFDNFTYQQYCNENSTLNTNKLDFATTGIDAKKEGDLYWYSPYVDIPGIASGRAIFKFIDVDDDKTAVFVLNSFETPVELRFNKKGWTVILADGTMYSFRTVMQSYTAPANRRVLYYDQSALTTGTNAARDVMNNGYGGTAEAVANSITPKTNYNLWYCDQVSHRNMGGQAINFIYKTFGEFNYFQEFKQAAYAPAAVANFANTTYAAEHDFKAFSDIFLERVESSTIHSLAQQLKLNYATNTAVLGANPSLIDFRDLSAEAGRLDSLYSYETVFSDGISDNFTNWKRYEHTKINSNTNTAVPNPTNPYLASGGYVRSNISSAGQIGFNHSFLETPRITGLIPGDIYEIKTTITRGNAEDLEMGNGTLDIAVVTGDLNNPAGTGTNTYSALNNNNNSGIFYLQSDYQATRGIPLFSTFNMAMKWILSYSEGVKQTSNFFVMPNIPDKFGGVNIQIGPGNADVNLSAVPSDVVLSNIPDAQKAYVFKNNGYPLKSAGTIPGNFGVGLPWGMMIPIYKNMAVIGADPLAGSTGNPNDVFKFWWNAVSGYTHANQPTKLDNTVELDKMELVRYSKNPYMLVSVESFTVNGEVGGPENEGLKLTAKKAMEYTQSTEPILENYAYAANATLQYKTAFNQIRILLKAVREIPVVPTTDTTKYPTTFLGYEDFTNSTGTTYNATQPLNGYTGKVLNRFVDHLGGITKVEYYPVTDSRTYYSNRFVKDQHCDLVVTTPAYGMSKAVTVHPVVKYILKNDEDDLVKTGAASSDNGHKRWHYDFDASTKVHKQRQLNNTDNRFHNGRKTAYDIGFRKVSVYGPTLVLGASSFINKTVYEHHGYQLTAGGGFPTIEDYLYHGKLKSIKEYDVSNKLFTEKLIDYDYTLAFKNGYTRPNLMQDDIQWDQEFDNPGGQYEYRDYYLDQTVTVSSGGNTYTGTNAYPHLSISVFNGTGEVRELPKFLDFEFYPELSAANPEFFLHSYFVKKAEEIDRTYDEYLYKQNIVSGGVIPVVVNPEPNPFGTGHVNSVSYLRSRDSVYFIYAANGSKTEYGLLLNNGPLSDTVLYKVIVSNTLSSAQKTQILSAQLGLSNLTWKRVITDYSRFNATDMIGLANIQPYFADEILEHLSLTMDDKWDNKLIESLFKRNEYLSYPNLLNFTDYSVDYVTPETYTAVLTKQPQMPEDILIRIVNSPYLAPGHLSRILQYQVLTDDVWTEVIENPDITNAIIDDIIEAGISYPSETILLDLMQRVPDLKEEDWARIVAIADRELETSVLDALQSTYSGAEFLNSISFKGSPLQKYCNTATDGNWNYIETKTTYEYYEADYLGISNGRAYKVLMGLEDVPGRIVSLTNFFGTGGTKTINDLRLKHEPSWQLFSSTTSSVHLPTAKQEKQYFYLYDLRNRYDRYWYNFDVNTVGGQGSSFVPVILNSNLDTIAYTTDWEAGYGLSYEDESPEIPKYDGMTKSRQYLMRSLPFQQTTITKGQRDEKEMVRSEYFFYDARWTFDAELITQTIQYNGESCPSNGEPAPDPEGCEACMYWKNGTEAEFMQQLPNNYCLWEDPVVGYWACPFGVNANDCHEGSELIDCKPTLGENNLPDPQRYLPPGALLAKTLQLRSVAVQMDTILGTIDTEFADKRFDRSNAYIAEFHMAYAGVDANGFERPYRMIYPYDFLVTTTVLERNEHLQPQVIKNQVDIKTRFYYDKAERHWNVNTACNNANYSYLYNYLSVNAKDIGLPVRVTVGYTRTDSLSTTFEYTNAGSVSKTTNPSGHYFDYTFDGFQRLTSVTENGSRLLSRNEYALWNHDASKTFFQRTDQNYVQSVLYNYYINNNNTVDTNQREVQKAFLDPLGRTAGIAKAYKGNTEIKIYSGAITYDNWGRVVEERKPFRDSDINPYNYRTNFASALKNVTQYENDPGSIAFRRSNYGVDINGNDVMRTSSVITNHIYAACELGLNKYELEQVMSTGSTSDFRFRRVSIIDQDEKETVTYTNAFGQKIATLGWSDLNTKVVTLFIYDNYGNVTKTINPLRQQTEYVYNIAGQLIIEKTVDGGTKRFIYNKHGLVSGIQDQADHDLKNGGNVRTPRYRKYTYDDYGKPTGQYLFTTNYNLDAFCYQTLYQGQIGNYEYDAQGQPHYFRYIFSNRMTQDWLNTYTTLDPVNTNTMITSGLPAGTGITEKTTVYGTNNASPATLGKVIETKSYNLSGVAVQKTTFTYDAQERIATQEIRQHPTNETTNDSKLVKAKISYSSYNYRGSLTEQRLDMGNDGSTEMQYFYEYDQLNRIISVRAAQGIVAISNATLLASYGYDDARGVVLLTEYSADKTNNVNVPVQVTSLSYDDRDRLTLMQSELFKFELFYDDQTILAGGAGSYTAIQQNHCHNGNVNGTRASYSTNSPMFLGATNYGYNYDRLNRLVQADAAVMDFVWAHSDNVNNPTPLDAYRIGDESQTYDKAGNIQTLLRVKPGTTNSLGLTFDDFVYSYTSGTNRLQAIDGLSGAADRAYTYDGNGNLLTDDFRGVTATTYGRASYSYNLTKGTDAISYLYDAADSRFYKKVQATAQTIEETYVKDALGHDLAIVKIITTGSTVGTPQYEYFVFGKERVARVTSTGTGSQPTRIYPGEATYFLYDYLGNTRVGFKTTGTTTLNATTVYCGDYYPYGKAIREYDNGDGDRYLTTMHERDRETGFDYRGARYYDSDVARFLSTDPWANKYPEWSTYNYVMGNPSKLIDPTGKGPTDWFLNTKSGNVVYVKGKSEMTQATLDKMGSKYSPGDYVNLGGDNMFGKKVEWATHGNILEKEFFSFYNYSEFFMETQGYVKAQNVTVEEEEVYSGEPNGSDGGGHSHTSYSIRKTDEGPITYSKREDLYEKNHLSEVTVSGQYNYFLTVTYDMMIPLGGDYKKDPYFSDNKTVNASNSILTLAASILDVFL